MKLVELARTVRSKNARPLELTLDLLLDDETATIASSDRLRSPPAR